MLKEELRLNVTSLRKNLSKEQIHTGSLAIANALLDLPIWSYNYYHIFLQIPEKKEIDTRIILSILQGRDKNIVIPKVGPAATLQHYLLTDATVIKRNRWNIPEPVDGLAVPAKKIDVVFVPLLGFDLKGNRVGYGKGYYDNFLRTCRADVIKIGLSLFEAVQEIKDVHENDIPLNYSITPEKSYSF
ncbi:MAG TPA: 5-formyltetrahydrofolate cyclo-ligase [Eudoraea sp.]|nr:5-formyltetrahydrofolate cyclo-ligase [Eudoraea sp.]